MKMSVREARAHFAAAIEAAARGERVTITRNGKPVAELGPPGAEGGLDWEAMRRSRQEQGWDGIKSEDVWPESFDDPAWSREVFGLDADWDPARR
jgi:prevent-host-death family protein